MIHRRRTASGHTKGNTMKRILSIVCAVLIGLAAMVLAGAPASATEQHEDREVYWAMPDGGTPENVTWPQTHAPGGATDCGIWYQVDLYPADAVDGLTADGILTSGEDSAVVISWRFEYGGDCPVIPEQPAPKVEETSSSVPDCEAKIITTTHVKLTYTPILVDNVWTFEGVEPVAEYSETTAPTTETECPVVVVPPVEPPVVEPPVVTPPVDAPVVPVVDDVPVAQVDELAETGAESGILPIVAALMVAAGVVLMIARRRASAA